MSDPKNELIQGEILLWCSNKIHTICQWAGHFILKSIMHLHVQHILLKCSKSKVCIVPKMRAPVLIPSFSYTWIKNWHLELVGECRQCFAARSTSQTASDNQQKCTRENNWSQEEVVVSRELRKMSHFMQETSFLCIDQNWQLELVGECQQSFTARSTNCFRKPTKERWRKQ